MLPSDNAIAPTPLAAPTSQVVITPHEWAQVRVDRVEVERAVAPSTLATIRAVVVLGRLLPVDVVAEATIEGGPDASLPETTTERMWCAHSFHNDRFPFEARVSDDLIARARAVRVRVRPAGSGQAERLAQCLSPRVEFDLAPRVEDGP